MKRQTRPYGRFLEEAARRGIRHTLAYQLRAAGLVETFSIGRARFVYLDTLDALPQLMQDPANVEKLKAARLGFSAGSDIAALPGDVYVR